MSVRNQAVAGDANCRVTVVGESKRVDISLPARTPVAEYVASVALLCGVSEAESLPPAWSLAPVGRRPLSLDSSLASAGIVDGAVLYLRDVLVGEADEPLVLDMHEEVTEAATRFGAWPWDRAHRAAAALALGALWLAVAVLATATVVPRQHILLPSGLAIGAALGSALVPWIARTRSWSLPLALRLCTAFAAVPELAVAGARLSGPHAAISVLALNAAVGATAGSFALPIASPGFGTGVFPLVTALGLIVTAVLGGVHASLIQCAAAVTVLCLALGALAPWTVGRLATYSLERGRLDDADSEAVAAMVRRARGLLVLWNCVLAAVLAVALVMLAGSGDDYALALVCSAAAALVARSSGFKLLTEALPGVVAAAAGLLAMAFEAPSRLHAPWWAGSAVAAGLGTVLLIYAIAALLRGRQRPRARPAWHAYVAALCSSASVPLALGLFGVYTHLVAVGHTM